jgi:hypothetical protein
MGANDDREMLVAAKAECVRLERENAKLRADLDARFEHSDHQSAKYYRRMRDAERAGDRLREQLAEANAEVETRRSAVDEWIAEIIGYKEQLAEAQQALTIASGNLVDTTLNAERSRSAQAQATIEHGWLFTRRRREAQVQWETWCTASNVVPPGEMPSEFMAGFTFGIKAYRESILSAPSSTGGNDE